MIFVVLWAVEEEGLFNLWSGVTPAILRHVGKFISPNTTTLFFPVLHQLTVLNLPSTSSLGRSPCIVLKIIFVERIRQKDQALW